MRFSISLSNYNYLQGLGCDGWNWRSDTLGYIVGTIIPFTASGVYQAASGPTTINDLIIRIWKTSESTTIPKWQSLYLGPIIDGHDYRYDVANDVLTDITPGTWAATITSRKLRYGGLDYDFGGEVPSGTSGLARITARNDSTQQTYLRLAWLIMDPDGTVVQDTYYVSGLIGVGATLTLDTATIVFGKAGTWYISMVLSVRNMETGIWLVADSWPAVGDGDLCTVAAPAPPTNAPVLVSPANGASVTGTSITFSWQAVARADDYQLVITKGGVAFYSQNVGNVTQVTVPGFSNDGSGYEWKVRGQNASGAGPYSALRTLISGIVPGVFSNLAVSYIVV